MRKLPRMACWSLLLGALTVATWVFVSSAQGPEGGNTTATATESQPVLVELFTSEGCSSCPPADELLGKMDAQPIPGTQLIVLSEHVTYWDHDGWKDPNSSSVLTDRQSLYEDALGLKTPYTPQIIVDGTSVLRVGDAQQARDIFEKVKAAAKVSIRIDGITVDAGSPSVLRARITADGTSDHRSADVYVAVALNRVESQVLRGENGGRHLVHVAVVEQLTKIGKLQKGTSFEREVQLKLKPGEDPKSLRIIAFIQEPGPGKVIGAALRKPVS